MSAAATPRLPATFNRLAWSNLAAQSAEQIALAAQQLATPAEPPAIEDADDAVTPPATISGTGKATLGPKS